jgi:hypothetical protein
MLGPEDHAEILLALSRYAAAIDLRRWELMDEVFLPEAEIYMNGAMLKPAARGVAVIRSSIECCNYTQHLNGTPLIEETAEGVTVMTQVRAWHRGGPDGAKTLEAVGRYLDLFVRTAAGWRIARRREEVPVFIGDETLFADAAPVLERMLAETARAFPGGPAAR